MPMSIRTAAGPARRVAVPGHGLAADPGSGEAQHEPERGVHAGEGLWVEASQHGPQQLDRAGVDLVDLDPAIAIQSALRCPGPGTPAASVAGRLRCTSAASVPHGRLAVPSDHSTRPRFRRSPRGPRTHSRGLGSAGRLRGLGPLTAASVPAECPPCVRYSPASRQVSVTRTVPTFARLSARQMFPARTVTQEPGGNGPPHGHLARTQDRYRPVRACQPLRASSSIGRALVRGRTTDIWHSERQNQRKERAGGSAPARRASDLKPRPRLAMTGHGRRSTTQNGPGGCAPGAVSPVSSLEPVAGSQPEPPGAATGSGTSPGP